MTAEEVEEGISIEIEITTEIIMIEAITEDLIGETIEDLEEVEEEAEVGVEAGEE